MRRSLLVAALLCALLPASASARPKYPYVAYVAVDSAPLRSGPGEEHYFTDRLERGTKVEVHRHDPGGWYAVRPLPGSFSWVPASQTEMTDEPDVAVVTKEGVVSWVGTRDGESHDLKWQVELKKGEFLEVLGAKKMSLAEGEQEEICYKIAPPPGEFRWIKHIHVTRRGADELAEEPAESPAETPKLKPVPESAGSDKPDTSSGEVKLAALELPIEETKNTAPPLVASPGKTDGFVSRKKNTGAAGKTASEPAGAPATSVLKGATPAVSTAPSTAPSAAPPNSPVIEDSNFETRLRELDVELSLMVAREPSAWNLAPLRQRTAALMDAGQTPLERGRARLLVEKIDEFAEFARRRTPVTSVTPVGTPVSATTPADAQPKNLIDTTSRPIGSGVRGTEFAPDIEPRYDGMGWLVQVHSQNPRVPRYALTDTDGRVLHYITPSPGLNLNRYLRTQVGIYGQRGYVPELHTPQLTAQRVVSLERHRK